MSRTRTHELGHRFEFVVAILDPEKDRGTHAHAMKDTGHDFGGIRLDILTSATPVTALASS